MSLATSLFMLLSLAATTAARAEEVTAPAPAAGEQPAIAPVKFQLTGTRHSNRDETPTGLTGQLLKIPHVTTEPAFTLRHIGKDTVEQATADGSIKIRSSSARAGALLPGTNTVGAQLSPTNSWRNETSLSLTAPLGSDVKISIFADALNMRAPQMAGMDRGIGEPTYWTENKAFDLAAKLSLFDDVLTYSGGLAWSDYRMVRTTRFQRADDPLLGLPQSNGETAYWQRVELNAQLGSKRGLTAYVTLGDAGQDFRTFQRFSSSPLTYNGKSFETGGKLQDGGHSLTWNHRSVRDAFGDTDETTARADLGSVQITQLIGRASYDFALDDRRYQDATRYRTTAVKITLSRLLGVASKGWMPDNVMLRLKDRQRSSSGADSFRSTLEVSAGWTRGDTSTDIGISRVQRQSRWLLVDKAPSSEMIIDFSHSRTIGSVEVSGYGSVDVEHSETRSNSSYTGGVSLSADAPLKFSLSLDYNRMDQRDESLPLMQNRGLSLSGSADLTPWLRPLKLPSNAYMKMKVFSNWDRSRFGTVRPDVRLAPGAMLMFGTRL